MKSLRELNSKQLLFIIFKLSGKQNDGFSKYFNDIRDEFEIEHSSKKRYYSSPGQVHNWLFATTPKTIRDTNFSLEMAKYIFEDIYKKHTNTEAILDLLLVTFEAMEYDISDWKPRFQNCTSASDYDNLWDEIIEYIVLWSFTVPKKQKRKKAHETNKAIKNKTDDSKKHNLVTPRYLTDLKYRSKSSLCFRDDILKSLHSILLPQNKHLSKTNILLFGLGGIGKSSIAHRFLSEAVDSELYDSYGWINYNTSIKESILQHNNIHLYENELDTEKRWKQILDYFQTTSSRILLFIDNVDQDIKNGQIPSADSELQLLMDCPAVNVILTSRLKFPIEPRCIQPLEVPPLDDEQCYKLFLYYWSQTPVYNEEIIIRNIVKNIVHYHTLAIKLIALGSRGYTMDEMSQTIQERGFYFDYLEDGNEKSAAEALLLLFNPESRSPRQKWLLWQFSLLPQTSLSLNECKELFGFKRSELLNLADEGWLTNENGFSMHPLIKQAMYMTYEKEGYTSLQGDSTPHIIRLVLANKLIKDDDTHFVALRKLSLADSFSEKYVFKSHVKTKFFYNLANIEFNHARKRLSAIRHLRIAKDSCIQFSKGNTNFNDELANILYKLGYFESTTHKYRDTCKYNLRKALELWSCHQNEFRFKIANAKSHLGYVLTDNPCDYDEAQSLLLDAKRILDEYSQLSKFSVENEPKWLAYDRSTVLDNLGMLLWKKGGEENIKKAKDHLMEAFVTRESLNSDTDIAWTAFNIGKLLSENTSNLAQAEFFFTRSLEIRRKLDAAFPKMYTTNVVFSLVALAKVLYQRNKIAEAQKCLQEANVLKISIDEEHTGFFSEEINHDISELTIALKQS